MARIVGGLVVLSVVSASGIAAGDAPGDRQAPKLFAADFGWLTEYRAALETARETNKPIMVVFRCVP